MKTGKVAGLIGAFVFGFVFGLYTPFPQCLLYTFLTGCVWAILGAWYDRSF